VNAAADRTGGLAEGNGVVGKAAVGSLADSHRGKPMCSHRRLKSVVWCSGLRHRWCRRLTVASRM
jgi:hypothetical protein